MGNKEFEIYYQEGLKQGVSREDAINSLAKLLKVPLDKAENMIAATNRVIKSGLSKDQAMKYYVVLGKLGMQVEIRQTVELPESHLSVNERKETVAVEETETTAVSEPVKQTVDYDRTLSSDKPIQLQFNGKGLEYFKIWIVNIFLTIVTLGIYSAWAKVRNKQYFYGNTVVDGSSFSYTAKPVSILKGRLIAVGLLVLYVVVNQFAPLVGFILFLVLMSFLPWIIIRSLAFNARNSVFRNIRFNFTASVGDAVKAFLLWPLLLFPTLGLILPFVWYKQSRFFVNNSAYGTTGFQIHATAKDYYKIFFIFIGVILLLVALMSVLMAVLGIDPNNQASIMPVLVISGPLSLVFYLLMFGYLAASLGNLYFNSSTLGEHGFTSNLKTKNMSWLYFSNTLAIVLSLGLLIPWVRVRMARYRLSCLQLNVKNSLDDFIAAEQKHVSALAEQVGEVFDMDVSVL